MEPRGDELAPALIPRSEQGPMCWPSPEDLRNLRLKMVELFDRVYGEGPHLDITRDVTRLQHISENTPVQKEDAQ